MEENLSENRYRRLEQLGWKQSILKSMKVLVVGSGAIGNEVIKNLALLGVGQIYIVDMDTIETHNLTRSVLFRPEDIGKEKSIVAAKRAIEIDPSIQTIPFVSYIQTIFGLGAYRRFDVVFGCLDNLQARRDINRYCYQTNTIYIDGGLNFLDGSVRCFASPYKVCFDCILSSEMRNRAWKRFSCLKLLSDQLGDSFPTAPTISAIVAGLMVQIAVKYMHGMTIPNGEEILYMGNIDDPGRSKFFYNPDCPTHMQYDQIISDDLIMINHNSQKLTLKDLINIVKQKLGEKAVLKIDFELIESFECYRCETKDFVFKRKGFVFLDDAICRKCELKGNHKIEDLIRRPEEKYEFYGNEVYVNRTLQELNFPKLSIYEGYNDKQQLFFEIFGDEKDIFI